MPKKEEIVVDSQNPNQIVTTRGTGMDEDKVGAAKQQEESDEKRNKANLARGGAVDDTPKAEPGEGIGAFSARMSAYRKKKAAQQAAALK